jgi:pimeloyl-ACP methyl ester carboxylesterase
MPSAPTPYRLQVADATLADLRARLQLTRWPDEPPGAPWSTGTSLGYLQGLVAHWQQGFDWRAQEAALNGLRQFTVPVSGIDLHFIHEPGVGPDPLPLLLSHGWPGSVFEFLEIVPLLCDPGRHGGDPADAFTIVAPSLPGYTLSYRPGQARFGVSEIAATFHTLMTEILGYRRFGAQGGDWGSFVSTLLAARWPEALVGLHLNMLPLRRDAKARENPSEEERDFIDALRRWLRDETGYQAIQGTKPQTLAYALNDSPAGLAGWIVEKFRTWSDCDGDPENAIARDRMLANITLYWATGSIGSSFWPYYARLHEPWPIADGATIAVPLGYAEFPTEILRPPRSLAERLFPDIRRWTPMAKGGHFAALEQPERLAHEIREFFRPLRNAPRQ